MSARGPLQALAVMLFALQLQLLTLPLLCVLSVVLPL